MGSNFGFLTPLDAESIQFMAASPTKPSPFELIQNCDLPPPVKVFPGPNRTAKLYRLMGREDESVCGGGDELLKALRLSQTRAREAEKRSEGLAEERESVADALFQESLRVLAYKNWIRVLEVEVSVLKLKLDDQEDQGERLSVKTDEEAEEAVMSWVFSLAIAGFGVAIALRYLI